MELSGYQFSHRLEELYNVTISTIPNSKLSITAEDNIIAQGAGGAFYINDATGENIIEIKKDSLNEDTISHELLHCYFYNKGYPKVKVLSNVDDTIHYFAQHIENCLIHTLVYNEQDRSGIDRHKTQESFSRKLGTNRDSEPDNFPSQIRFSMKILEAEIRCGQYKQLYAKRIRKNFSNSYTYALRIYGAASQQNYKTPFGFRKALIRALREIDKIAAENGFPKLQLNRNVAIGFIPTAKQLDLKLDKIFDFYGNVIQLNSTNENVSLLVSKADNQTSYFITLKDVNLFKNQMTSLTLKDFYILNDISYLIR